jgi:hypothetical protein
MFPSALTVVNYRAQGVGACFHTERGSTNIGEFHADLPKSLAVG